MIFSFNDIPASRTALQEKDFSLAYGQLQAQGMELARTMGKRSLVFCLSENSIASFTGHFAALNYGHVPLLLSANINMALLLDLLEAYQPDHVWAPSDRISDFPGMEELYSFRHYSLLRTPYGNSSPMHPELAMLLPTSGSTGSPKLVRHSYGNLRSNIAAIAQYLGTRADHVAISSLPMNYTYGLSVIHIHLWAGAATVMTNAAVIQEEFWELMSRFRVTSLSGVPYTWEMLRKVGIMNMELPALAHCDQAGGKLHPDLQDMLIDWAHRTGRTFTVMYGQTEASPRMGYLPWEKARFKHGGMGIPVPGGAFELHDEQGKLINGADEVGELVYLGPNVTMGYALKREDLNDGDVFRGVLRTGDLAKRDEEGFYSIVGRKGRFLKIFGNRVNLDELEKMLGREFPAMQCACVGQDDLVHVCAENCADPHSVKRFLADRTRLNPMAFRIVPYEKIPRNESGKVTYAELKKQLLAD